MVGELADAIHSGRVPVTDGTAGLRVLDVLDAADRSLATGGTAVIPDPNRELEFSA